MGDQICIKLTRLCATAAGNIRAIGNLGEKPLNLIIGGKAPRHIGRATMELPWKDEVREAVLYKLLIIIGVCSWP
jgi:hypothetical protein